MHSLAHQIGIQKKWLMFFFAALTAVGLLLAPLVVPSLANGETISLEALYLAAIFLVSLTLWATETLPIAITALLAVTLQPLLGVTGVRDAFASFMSPVFFFVIAMYIIAGVINETGLDKRFALFLLAKAGTRSTHIIFAMMLGTAILSSIMSDVPACAVFMAIGLGILGKSKVKPGQSNFAKALMMGIPIAALIGGIATPAGSSINVLALDLFAAFSEQHQLDITISFIQWMALGIPMVIFLVPLAWWILIRCYPPEFATLGSARSNTAEFSALGPLSVNERKVLIIMAIMIVLWIAGSWIKLLNVAIVALLGAIIMFMPGIRLISWKKAERHIGWDTLLMIGGVSSLGQASVKTGLAEWLVQTSMSGVSNWPLFWIIALISLLTVLIHLPLPIAPVVNAVLIPPIAALALSMNINPVILILPVAFTASCAFLLPLDAVPLLTFSKGYYRMFDMLLPGSIISLCWIILMTILITWVAPVVQLF
ncbi:MAG: DASS family sodium-coupled anion symporter [Methylococcaceae bacterium]